MTISQLCLIFILSFVLGAQSQTPTVTPVLPTTNSGDSGTDGTPGGTDVGTDLPTELITKMDFMTELGDSATTAASPSNTNTTETVIATSATPSGLICTPACGENEICSGEDASPNSCVCIEGYIKIEGVCQVKTCDNIQCGAQGKCIGNNTVFEECDCNLDFSFKEGDICIDKTCDNSKVCSGPGDSCENHYISFMCFCGENRTHNEDHSDCVDKTCENSNVCSGPGDKCMDHASSFMCECGENRTLNKDQSDCVAKTCNNSCQGENENCTMENGYNCTCNDGYSRQGDYCRKNEVPVTSGTTLATDNGMITGTPMSVDTLTTFETSMAPEILSTTENPITAKPSETPTKSTKPSKSTMSKEPVKPGTSTESLSTPNKKDVTGGHSYKGAIIGLFVFLMVTCLVFLAVYILRRRKLRNNYGRLDEDTEGDSGWSAFSKNPIYRGDRDYQLL